AAESSSAHAERTAADGVSYATGFYAVSADTAEYTAHSPVTAALRRTAPGNALGNCRSAVSADLYGIYPHAEYAVFRSRGNEGAACKGSAAVCQ
ncbi:MAG: hypothetical protein NC078_03310, partial [Ruminococcus sp.]|nr:hypothetical protein [Ruminococcus sp.]